MIWHEMIKIKKKQNTFIAWLKSIRLGKIMGLAAAVMIIRLSYWETFTAGRSSTWLFVIPVFFIAAGGAIINDYFDIKEDRAKRPQSARIGRVIKRRVAMMSHWVLTGLGLGVSVILSKQIDSLAPLIIAATSALLIFLYSIWLKKKTVVGKLVLASIVSLIVPFALVDVNGVKVGDKYLWVCLFIFIIVFIRQISKELEVIDLDKSSGFQTMPVVYGTRRSWLVIYATEVLLVFCTMYLTAYKPSEIFSSIIQSPFETFFLVTALATIYFSVRKNAPAVSAWLKLMLATGLISLVLV
mgnify:CR=1 FL=1